MFENALLYGPGDATDPDSEIEENEGLNDVDAEVKKPATFGVVNSCGRSVLL